MRPHVVVLGLDGVRYDTLLAARTPELDAVAAAGFLAPVRVNDAAPTISGPGWATIATGVLADKHGIYDNDLTGHQIATYPDFLTRVRAALPHRATRAWGSWPQLVRETYGGPIFLGGGGLPYGDDPPAADWDRADELVAESAATALGAEDLAAAFVYFGLPDVVAHEEGLTPAYTAAVESCDRRIGRVLAAIRRRPSYDRERWTVIAVTDHGHVDVVGGHGGDTDAERTAWIAACGPGVPGEPPGWLEQADVHAHVLAALGVEARREWALTGRPFSARPGRPAA